MLTELTKAFIKKVETERIVLRQLSIALGIDYDRMYKWAKGKANPKPPDDGIIQDWINGKILKNVPRETLEEKDKSNMDQDYREKYIAQIEKENRRLETEANQLQELMKQIEGRLRKMEERQISIAKFQNQAQEAILDYVAEQKNVDRGKFLLEVYNKSPSTPNHLSGIVGNLNESK